MQVYVYEHATASTPAGRWADLEAEGLAMLRSVSRDLAATGARVAAVVHASRGEVGLDPAVNCAPSRKTFREALAASPPDSFWLLIAPETDGVLLDLAQNLEASGRRSLGPDVRFIRAASDKLELSRLLQGCTPRTSLDPREHSRWKSLICKPRTGAGCTDVVSGPRDWFVAQAAVRPSAPYSASQMIFQPVVEGDAASLSAIGTPDGALRYLPAAGQDVSRARTGPVERWRYEGGRLPLSAELNRRARRVADFAFSRLPPVRGFVGVDLVLGRARDGSEDVAIEVNARPTTSYVGYSEWARRCTGDPAAMGRWILGGESPTLPVDLGSGVVEYTTGGRVRWT